MLWLKALHVIAVMSWMAGLLYLPRLFVYHAEAKPESEAFKTFKVMEERLLRIIMTPAMMVVWITGLVLAWGNNFWLDGWFLAKLALVVAMTVFHGKLAKNQRAVKNILTVMHGTRFIFNLGHGIVPQTPPEHVEKPRIASEQIPARVIRL